MKNHSTISWAQGIFEHNFVLYWSECAHVCINRIPGRESNIILRSCSLMAINCKHPLKLQFSASPFVVCQVRLISLQATANPDRLSRADLPSGMSCFKDASDLRSQSIFTAIAFLPLLSSHNRFKILGRKPNDAQLASSKQGRILHFYCLRRQA